GRRDLVVDAPADVLRPRLPAIRPPRVLPGSRVDTPEHVDEAELVEHVREPRALFRQEAGILLVAAPVAQINRLMSDVPIAAQHDFPAARDELRKVWTKRLEEP